MQNVNRNAHVNKSAPAAMIVNAAKTAPAIKSQNAPNNALALTNAIAPKTAPALISAKTTAHVLQIVLAGKRLNSHRFTPVL